MQAATEVDQDVLEGKNVIESAKSHGKQAAGDVAKATANKVIVGRGRKKGIKRAAPEKKLSFMLRLRS